MVVCVGEVGLSESEGMIREIIEFSRKILKICGIGVGGVGSK